MFRSLQFIAACFVTGALACVPAVSATANSEEKMSYKAVNLTPFTHIAYIPVDADLSSIRFKGIKAVKVASRRRSIADLRYCNEQRLVTEPGGSMYCPLTTDISAVSAYQVTYTFTAPPIPSDEHGANSFTFSVYFRPDELSRNLRRALSSGRISRTDLSEYFEVNTSTASVQQDVIDQANSSFCDGSYVDGNWTHTNPKCRDSMVTKEVPNPSPFITVRIDPASLLEASLGTIGVR